MAVGKSWGLVDSSNSIGRDLDHDRIKPHVSIEFYSRKSTRPTRSGTHMISHHNFRETNVLTGSNPPQTWSRGPLPNGAITAHFQCNFSISIHQELVYSTDSYNTRTSHQYIIINVTKWTIKVLQKGRLCRVIVIARKEKHKNNC